MTFFLVRHGRPLIDPATPAASWELDPAGFDDVWALRERLPQDDAEWFTSPEPKAVATCQLLTEGDVGILDGLREQERGAVWVEDLEATVRRAFADPDAPAHPGWEPLAATRERLLAAVRPIRHAHAGTDVVLVGHGTAWTLLAAELTGSAPDLDRWARLGMPDVITLPEPLRSLQ
ncbi:histidine phosphatase family protein [Nocardioides ochotonae]|uniref:histidine phosphatase family protein n=1 Tax=Nocardioides ochotonae TaxID=2685869 RepID=UPI00140B5BEB|nr:histidine phosphatase family protein [Nocardioides ochotonae]